MHNLVSSALTPRYKSHVSSAHAYELAHHDVILCTCSAASAPSLVRLNVRQIIIDECAMSTEPETLIPLVSHCYAEKVSPFQRSISRRAAQGSQTSAHIPPLTMLLFQVLSAFKDHILRLFLVVSMMVHQYFSLQGVVSFEVPFLTQVQIINVTRSTEQISADLLCNVFLLSDGTRFCSIWVKIFI